MPGVVALPRVRVALPPAPANPPPPAWPIPGRGTHLGRRRRHWPGPGPPAHLSDRRQPTHSKSPCPRWWHWRFRRSRHCRHCRPRANSEPATPPAPPSPPFASTKIPVTAPKADLSDRYRAAAEKHTGRPAIASRTPIAPRGTSQHELSGIATIATDPATGGGAQTEPSVCTVPLNHCREAVPPIPPLPPAPPWVVSTSRLWMNRRQRRQPPRSTALPHRLTSARDGTIGGERHRAAGAARAAIARDLFKVPLRSFIPPSPPWPPNEFVTSPNVARPVI